FSAIGHQSYASKNASRTFPCPIIPSSVACGLTGLLLLPNRSSLQQRPHHPHEIVGGGHERDLLPLRVATLGTLEIRADGGRTALRLPGGLGNQLPHHRCAFTGNVPEPILVARLVRTRNESEIATDCFGMAKALRVIHERRHRFGGANAHSGNAAQ